MLIASKSRESHVASDVFKSGEKFVTVFIQDN